MKLIKNVVSRIQCKKLLESKKEPIVYKATDNYSIVQSCTRYNKLDKKIIDSWIKKLKESIDEDLVAKSIHITDYKEGDFIAKHNDIGTKKGRVLTCIVLISAGVDNNLIVDGKKVEMNTGDAVLFPSSKQHEITRVKDKRTTVVMWWCKKQEGR